MSRLEELRTKYPEATTPAAEIGAATSITIVSATYTAKRFGYDVIIDNPDLGIFGVFDGSAASPVVDQRINEHVVRAIQEEKPITNIMEAKRQMKEQLATNRSADFLLTRIVSINDSVYAVIGNRGNSHAYSYKGGENVQTLAGKNAAQQPADGYFSGISVYELTPGERLILSTNGGLSSVQKKDARGNSLASRTLGARSAAEAVKNIAQLDTSNKDKAYMVIDVDFAPRKKPEVVQRLGGVAIDVDDDPVAKAKAEAAKLKLPPAPGKQPPETLTPAPRSPFRKLYNQMKGLPPNYDGTQYTSQTEQLANAQPLTAVGFCWMENESNRWFRVKKFHNRGELAGNFEIVEVIGTQKSGKFKLVEIDPRQDTVPYDDKEGGIHYGYLVHKYMSIPEFLDMLERKNKLEDLQQ